MFPERKGIIMAEFFSALSNPDIAFLRYALVAGLLGSIAFGIIGTYVVTRRISYIAGAIAHSALGGIGAGLYLQIKAGIVWFTPLFGAVVSAIASGIIIGYVSMYARQREDTVIGAIWAIGMATGLLFLTKTPGYVEPMSYLFGNILMIARSDLFIICGLDAAIIILSTLFYNKFLAVAFDEEFARLRGVRTGFYYLLLLCLTALTVVLMVTVVGIVMVIALLTLPSAVAGLFSKQLWQMMIFSSLICMVFTSLGLGFSYVYDLPTGSNIILFAGAVYLLAIFGAKILKRRKPQKSM
jgi:zinc transport system permease protein